VSKEKARIISRLGRLHETAEGLAKEYVKFTYKSGNQGPCLLPKPGSKAAITSHERDFCQCEVEAAYVAGWLDAIDDEAW